MAKKTAERSRLKDSAILIVLALLLAGAGVFLVAGGLGGPAPAAAPIPESTFDLGSDDVSDPVVGMPPTIEAEAAVEGEAQASRPGPAAADAAERRQVPAEPLRDGRLVIPAIGVDTELMPRGLAADNSLILPSAVDEVTYWTGSAPVQSDEGGILVAGHVDNANQGEGALYWMHTLHPGDAVYLTKDGVVTRWKVVRMERFVKQRLPEWVFQGASGARELHIVTCGGEIVKDSTGRGTYLENVVLTAVPF